MGDLAGGLPLGDLAYEEKLERRQGLELRGKLGHSFAWLHGFSCCLAEVTAAAGNPPHGLGDFHGR